MTRMPARLAALAYGTAFAALALAVSGAAPLAAQESSGTFNLPPQSPPPTPAPAGPSDVRGGVAIPPQAAPSAAPMATPTTAPRPQPSATLPAPVRTTPAPAPAPTIAAPTTAAPAPMPSASSDPLALPGSFPATIPQSGPAAAPESEANTDTIFAFPAWELIAAGGLAALVLLGAGLFLWHRRKPKVLRLAAPSAAAAPARASDIPLDLADLRLSLDITTATRSLMMFTLGYRLNIANRAGRAVTDVRIAVQLACARASANTLGANAPSAGAAQALGDVERIGSHQSRSISGEVQLALSAIQPLRQGTTALFVPLIHVTIAADGQPAVVKTFVIGSPSASGRVHPILLDQPPGGIVGLVAQAVALPAKAAAA